MSEISILIVCRSGKYPEMPESTLTRSSEPFSSSITALGKLLSLVRMHSSIMEDCCILGSRWFNICHFYFPGGQHGGSPVLRDTVIFSPAAFSQIVYRLTARIYSKKMVKNILTKPPLNSKIKLDLLL